MLGLLIDVSGSQRTVLADQRRASQQFIDQVLRPQDRAFFVRFDRRIELLDNLSQLEIDPKESSARGTALYDAIISAARGLADQPGRKALIVLSDGYDTSSSAPLSAAVETAQRADALVYSIRFLDRDVFAFQVPASQGGSPVPREGRKALERIATETGGSYFDLAAAETLEKIYSRIEDELRNQYSLGFTPVNPRPGYRKIRVSVKRKGVTVQARDGYFPAQ
jgi:VWFA-related protein